MKTLRIATRGSELALWQANFVASQLGCPTELVVVSTKGDKDQSSLLTEIGGQGVFVKEVQAALLDGLADLAVHSAKDLPTEEVEGLEIVAFPKRGDVRDALVGQPLYLIPKESTIATGSQRRQLQLASIRPDLKFIPLRGNIATRIAKSSQVAAVVVAYAALERLGQASVASQIFDSSEMLPQVGQGALAIECRSQDSETSEIISRLDDKSTRLAVEAERSLLRQLGSGCSLPVGAFAQFDEVSGRILLRGIIGTLDGVRIIRSDGTGDDPTELGIRVGQALLRKGGDSILDEVNREVNE